MELEKGIQGLVVMSTELEEIFNCIFDARVPPMWERVGGSWFLLLVAAPSSFMPLP